MDIKAILGKFIKGAIGGAGAAASALLVVGQPVQLKALAVAVGVGAFHAGWEAVKQSFSSPIPSSDTAGA